MKTIGSIIAAPLKLLGIIKTPPKPSSAAVVRPLTRDAARDAAAQQDELRRRRGSAADVMTGPSGAEAGSTGKVTLG